MLDAADILSAQERMSSIVDGATAAGNLKKGQSRDHVRRLQKTVERASERTSHVSAKSGVADLQAFGISVVQVPKAGGS